MTVRYHWSVQSEAPLHFAVGRALGAAPETLPYIPGTALRGALAAAFCLVHGDAAPGFRPLIEEARFSNLYPAPTVDAASAPLPLSSVTCSHIPGFLADDGHGVSDLLVPAEAALLVAEATTAAATTAAVRPPQLDFGTLLTCRRCSEERPRLPTPATVPWYGFCAWRDGKPYLASVQYDAAFERQAGRDRFGGQSVTVRRTLSPGQHFLGAVAFPDDDTAGIASQLLQAQENRLWVGAGRFRGLGALRVDVSDVRLPVDDLATRQEGLTAALARASGRAGVSLPADQWYVTLTLQSSALLPDAFGRWQRTLSVDTLSDVTGLPAGALQVRHSFVGVTPVEGWNAALGLPKSDALAIAGGSCWLLRVQGVALADLLVALQRLEDEGIGERRQEGFGVVRACDPLHWQVQELEQEQPE